MSTPVVPLPTADTSAARYQRALDEIYGRLNYERSPDSARSIRDFRLTQMRDLLSGLGNPQLTVPTVHVAGSKGKGSTATMIAATAQAAGYRVGLFTSPHVDRFEERFTINGVPPEPEEVADLFEIVQPIATEIQQQTGRNAPTFFELATALAWLHFSRQRVDLAVMEVGLGGRLDSTNVCQPLVTVITSISRDHTRLLGNTLAAIAREKAGIIKPGIPVISGVTNPEPAEVIASIAAEQGAPLFRLEQEFQHHPYRLQTDADQAGTLLSPPCYAFDFDGLGERWNQLELSLPGLHQTRNGAIAAATAHQLRKHGLQLTEEAIRNGLRNARCPLRVEVVAHSPLTIVDAAHNPASITALCDSLHDVAAERRIAIFGSSRDKEADVLLQILEDAVDEIWLTRFVNNPRAIELDELQQIAARTLKKPCRVLESPTAALEAAAAKAGPRDLVCVTGSFFLAAEAKAVLLRRQPGGSTP